MKRGNAICAILMIGLIGAALVALMYDVGSAPQSVIVNEDATFSGNIQQEGDTRLHTIRIYENVTSIHCVLLTYGNDYDLYGRFGNPPSLSTYDFRGYTPSGEDLTHNYPDPGIWYLMVHAYSGTGHYDLIIEFEYDSSS